MSPQGSARVLEIEGGIVRVSVAVGAAADVGGPELTSALVDVPGELRALVLDGAPDAFAVAEAPDILPTALFAAVRDRGGRVVVVLRGACRDAGADIALAADVVIAAASAELGPFPDADDDILTARVGEGRAKLLRLTRRVLRGEEAQDWGLVDLAVPTERLSFEVSRLVADARIGGPTRPVPGTGAPGWERVNSHAGITVERLDGAAKVVFDRPDRLNAFDLEMSEELGHVIRDLGADRTVRAVLVTGRGRAFSAGADLSAFARGATAVEADIRRVTNPMILGLRQLPQPVVAAVNGAAIGVGCSLALAADVVIASDEAVLHLAFSRVGLSLDGGATGTVVARAGFGAASRLALLGEPIGAREAVACGLVDRVEYADLLAGAADTVVRRLAEGATRSYAATKSLLNQWVFDGLDDALEREATTFGELAATRDFEAAVRALTRREAPVFRGFDDQD